MRHEDMIMAKGRSANSADKMVLRDIVAGLRSDVEMFGPAGDDASRINRIEAFLSDSKGKVSK